MVERTATSLAALYEADETAWLETMAQLAADRRVEDIDYQNLSEFLNDMARRDRREVYRRLVLLLTHLLKWEYQPEQRTRSWRATIRTQRSELRLLIESGTLRNHASAVLAKAYEEAREQAADEADVPVETFPAECAQTVAELIEQELEAGDG